MMFTLGNLKGPPKGIFFLVRRGKAEEVAANLGVPVTLGRPHIREKSPEKKGRPRLGKKGEPGTP